ncbi:ATP-dependent helicase, partial [Salmonella enterica subsp. enterica serovar Lubbock]
HIYRILGLSDSDSFMHLRLADQDVQQFLRDDVATLQAFGFDVILPAWLKSLTATKMRVSLSASTNRKSVAGLDDIIQFNWQVALGDGTLSHADFMKIVEEEREFIRVGNEWFRVDATWTAQIREIIDRAQSEKLTVRDLLFNDAAEELLPIEDDAID